MKDPVKRRYVYLMLSIFGGIGLSVVLFFVVYRFRGVGDALNKLGSILAPFAYGGVVAYLLRPMCNLYEGLFQKYLPKKLKKLSNGLAVGLSMISGLLIVYALIIMIAPQLFSSIQTLWLSLPDKISALYAWAMATFGENEKLVSLFNTIYNTVNTDLQNWADNTLAPYVSSVVSIVSGVGSSVWKVLMFLYNLLIGLIVAVYLLFSRKKFARQSVLIIRSALKPKWAELLLDEVARIRAEGVDREIFTLCKNEKYGQLIENLENVEDSASQMADFALSGQTVAQQITMLAGLTAEDADAALQHILCTDRMATMYIQPDGTAPQAGEDDEEEEE